MNWLKRLFAGQRRDTTKLRIEAEREHMHRRARELVQQSQVCLSRTQVRRAIDLERRAAE